MLPSAAWETVRNYPWGTTAMLIDYGAQSPEEMQDMVKRLQPRLKKLDGMVDMEEFTHTVSEREKLWEVRNGIFPCVAGGSYSRVMPWYSKMWLLRLENWLIWLEDYSSYSENMVMKVLFSDMPAMDMYIPW